jgi:hypothetical protein
MLRAALLLLLVCSFQVNKVLAFDLVQFLDLPKAPKKVVVFGQSKDYFRKSITSPDYFIFLDPSDQQHLPKNALEIVRKKILLQRFDFNYLPKPVQSDFSQALSQLKSPSVEEIKALIESHISETVKDILQNPSVQKSRLERIANEDTYTFSSLKGKSYSLTDSDLQTLFESAFIFVPYLNPLKHESAVLFKHEDSDRSDKKILKQFRYTTVDISGGLLWYQIIVNPDFTVSVHFIDEIKLRLSKDKSFLASESEKYSLDVTTKEAFYDWVSGLSDRVQAMNQFRISGDIANQDNYKYDLSIYKDDGVNYNHYFWLMETKESEGGIYSEARGLAIVTRPERRATENVRLTKAYQVFGSKNALFSWVEEAPLSGYEFELGVLSKFGFSIDPKDAIVNGDYLFTSPYTRATALQFKMAKDISNTMKRTQRFIELDTSFSLFSSINDSWDLPYYYDYSLGYKARFWVKKWGISYFAKIGEKDFGADQNGSPSTKYRIESLQYKLGFSFEKMIHPFVLLSASVYMDNPIGTPRVTIRDSIYSSQFLVKHTDFSETGVSVGFRLIR